MESAGERAMTLLEVLVAAAIGVVVIGAVAAVAFVITHTSQHLDAEVVAAAAAYDVSERLHSEAASAWSVAVPAADAAGVDNSDGHALSFYLQDGAHRSSAWEYSWNAATHTLARNVYDAANPSATVATVQRYPGVTHFVARTVSVDDLRSTASSGYDALFARAVVRDAPYPYAQGVTGGNRLVDVTLTVGSVTTHERLASATAPSSFTVVVDYTPTPVPPMPSDAPAPSAAPVVTPTPVPPPATAGPTPAPTAPPTSAPTASGAPSSAPTATPNVTPTPNLTACVPSSGDLCTVEYVPRNRWTCTGVKNDKSCDELWDTQVYATFKSVDGGTTWVQVSAYCDPSGGCPGDARVAYRCNFSAFGAPPPLNPAFFYAYMGGWTDAGQAAPPASGWAPAGTRALIGGPPPGGTGLLGAPGGSVQPMNSCSGP